MLSFVSIVVLNWIVMLVERTAKEKKKYLTIISREVDKENDQKTNCGILH